MTEAESTKPPYGGKTPTSHLKSNSLLLPEAVFHYAVFIFFCLMENLICSCIQIFFLQKHGDRT